MTKSYRGFIIAALLQCLLLCFAPTAYPIDYRMRLFTMDDGLSNSNVNVIIQDSRGFIWIGTASGLNRYDGYDFKEYIPGREIKCLLEDSKGYIWAGLLDGKVCRLDKVSGSIKEYVCYSSLESNNGDVSGILESPEGFMWVSVDRMGLVKLDPETGEYIRYEHKDDDAHSLSHNAVTDMKMAADGKRIWLSTWGGGLNLFDPSTEKFTRCLDSLEDEDPMAANQQCLYVRGTDLWVGTTYSGILRYDIASSKMTQYKYPRDGIASNTVFDIAADADGNIWAAVGEGISVLNRQSGSFSVISLVVDNSPVSFRSPKTFCLDRDNTMWVGTTRGLLQYNKVFSSFDICVPTGHLLGSIQTSSILKTDDGSVWMIDDRGVHISRFDGNGVCTREEILPYNRFKDAMFLYPDSRGDIWIGHDSGIMTRYSSVTGGFADFDINKGENDKDDAFRTIYCCYEDNDGTFWLGGEVGVVNFNPRTGSIRDLYRSRGLIFPSFKTMDIIRDRHGNLWTATQGGVFRYGKGSNFEKKYTSDSGNGGLSSNIVNCLFEDSTGTIWACTAGGLDRFDSTSDRFAKADIQNGTSFGGVIGAEEDEEGNLWLTASVGLVRINASRDDYRIFDEEDGLLGKEFIYGAMTKASDGEILLGGYSGANRFYPSKVNSKLNAHDVFFDGFSIFNEPVDIVDEGIFRRDADGVGIITLSHNQSMLSFNFVSPNFISNRRDRYYYMLDGVDDHWIAAAPGIRSATYANLSPGNYVFKVKVSPDGNVEGRSPAQVRITIKPPFWASWWACLIYVAVLMAFAGTLIKFFLRRQKMRNRHEMDEFKLQFFTNVSHEFRTSLTLILGPLDYLLTKETSIEEARPMLSVMKGNASRLLRLVNQLLDFRKFEARKMTINNSTQDMVGFVRDVYNVFVPYASQQGVKYTFRSSVDTLVMDFDKDKVDKVIYNLLSNAFKYTDRDGRIELSLDTEKEGDRTFVALKVKDDGIGMNAETIKNLFTMFYQSPSGRSRFRGGSGLGLNMTKELLVLMGGDISVESEEGKGSTFTAYIPYACETETTGTKAGTEGVKPESAPVEPNGAPDRNKPLMLVVDDNPDMLVYIRTALENRFNVICAGTGEEALDLAASQMPDIVVSDVMMPEMDGMMFFSALKKDERTSHIPVIMLSAVSDEGTIAESFRMGVDGYINKPFSPEVLVAMIENIFSRRREQKLYTDMANPFVKRIMECIGANIQDSDYSIDRLAEDMNVSPVQLSKKCKEVLEMTPYSLIIKVRMDTAVRLMKETELNISEIAYRCGYQELSNFSRAFTRYWNESPKQLMKKLLK